MRFSRFTDLQKPWQKEQVIVSADDYFNGMLSAIDNAKDRVDMDFYMIRLDKVGLRFVDALSSAAGRGVKVRLMIDGVGSYIDASAIARKLSAAGVDVRVYHPLPVTWRAFKWSVAQGSFWQKLVYFSLQVNQRNHHKLCVIDRKELWTGSLNIAANHLPVAEGGEGWRDCGVHITDDGMGDVVRRMDRHWFKVDQSRNRFGIRRLWINFSPRQRLFKRRYMVRSIRNASMRVWITNAYFAPPQSIVRALLYAVKQGVDVRLIVPGQSDTPIFPLLSRSYYKQLVEGGVKVYEYQASILHAKLLLIDEACLIGSTNLNHRSLFHDLEVDTLLTDKQSINAVETMMQEDREESLEISRSHRYPWHDRLAMRCVRQFRYWF